MAKYGKEIVQKILKYYVTGEYTNSQICEMVGISEETFYAWKKGKPEFSESLKKAYDEKYARIAGMAIGGLKKLLGGHRYEEVIKELKKTEDGDEMVEVKRTTKEVMPNATAVIFALKNKDSDNFKDKQQIDHTSNGQTIGVQSDEEMQQRIEELEKINGISK